MTQDEFFSTLRSGSIFLAGAATVSGFNALSATDLQTDFDHMINGAKEFWLGAGPLVMLALAWWGKNKASLTSQKASVAASGALVVQPATPAAAVTVANAIAATPGVQQVTATKAVADATPSDKVVAPLAKAA
jgi:hypothetical protein